MGNINFRFTNRNVGEDGIRVYRSTEPFDSSSLPSVIATLDPGSLSFTDPDVVRGDSFYYMFETFRGGDSAFSVLTEAHALPVNSGPGPQSMIAGDNVAGFYGETLASDLITGDDLASAIGLTAGISQFSNEPWLKFNYEGKTLFVSKKPLRHSISWDHLNSVNGVYGRPGDAEIEIFGDTYSVRLLKGADEDPTDVTSDYNPVGTHQSEWNRLMYPIHSGVHTNINNPVLPEMGTWAQYSDADLFVLAEGNGTQTWCQETNAANAGRRVFRGYYGVSYFSINTSSSSGAHTGWRPCLELITD